jgi:hypothetical protein
MGVGISDAETKEVITMMMPISLANYQQTSAGNAGHYYLSVDSDNSASATNHYAWFCANDDCTGTWDPRFMIVPSLRTWSP